MAVLWLGQFYARLSMLIFLSNGVMEYKLAQNRYVKLAFKSSLEKDEISHYET